MRQTILIRLAIIGLLVVLAAAAVGFYLAFKSALPETIEKPPEAKQIDEKIQEIHAAKKPAFGVYIKDKRTVVVQWNFLPIDTKSITVFRSKKGTDAWTAWKTITVPPGQLQAGSVEIRIGSGENPLNYEYYAQGSSGTGVNTWISTSTVAQTTPPPLLPPTITPPSTVEPPIVITPLPTTTSTGPLPTPPSSSTPSAPQGEVYYTPSGQISGVQPTITAQFWVEHVNRDIRISYQNLPSTSNKVIIDRSSTQNGPWMELLVQENVDPNKLNSIGIVDLAISDPHYYRLRAFSGSSLLGTYGPVYLEGLSQ